MVWFMQRRLFVSASVMMFMSLVLSIPPVYDNRDIFPGARHMFTLHIEGCFNSLMLFAVGFVLPFLTQTSSFTFVILEITIQLGAWLNVTPWLYGGLTGAVIPNTKEWVTKASNYDNPPPNNDFHVQVIVGQLMVLTICDLIAWLIIIVGLLSAYPRKDKRQ
mmetsp:Transcript_24615/g.38373  ORF Transcript_24615/g.38373 Transcript_24615/m.38373 type:complete len:162 (-) Transcript_24615:55-540(-)